ncbi:diguanylate cyclase [Nocardioides caeni]|nr:diguanylate cyclase [Nocardioides caeni]
MDRNAGTPPTQPTRLHGLVGRAGLPGLVAGTLSLLVVLAMLGYLALILQPRLADLRQGQQAARDSNVAMLDQETGVRGYLTTGEQEFLEPYEGGLATVKEVEDDLVESLRAHPDLVTAAIHSITTAHEWQTQWAVPAVGTGPGGTEADQDGDGTLDAAETAAFLQTGKDLFDAYRVEDEALREDIKAEIRDTEGNIVVTLVVGGGILLVLGVGSIAGLVRSRRRLQQLVVAPIDDLTATVDRVRRGDLTSATTPNSGVVEIAALSDGVSAMTVSLAERAEAAERRERELAHRGARLERVLELSRDLNESLSLRYTTLRLVNAVRDLAGAARAELWLQRDGGQELVLFETSEDAGLRRGPQGGDGPEVVEFGAGPIGRAARYGRALPLDEMSTSDGETSSGVAIPMVVGARVVAVVAIVGKDEEALDLSLLDGLLLQGASAIQAAQLHTEVEEMSRRDALTGLANRRQFDADLLNEVERAHRYGRPLALVMIDLDHFKRINDVYGHRRGDEVLQDVAGLMTTGLREIDHCYRYGGEELCVLMPECSVEEAREAADRIRERVATSFPWAIQSPVTLSAGVAGLQEGVDPAALVGTADQALYAAKHAGRNQVHVAGP